MVWPDERAVRAPASVRLVDVALDHVLSVVATQIARVLRPDRHVAIVLRDRHGALTWGTLRHGDLSLVEPAAAHQPAIASALDGGIETSTDRLLVLPIGVAGRITGALLVAALGSGLLDRTELADATAALDNWVVTLDNALGFAEARDKAANLEAAMRGRAVIEQAKGIVMARDRCDADTAFDTLREISQRADLKLVAVATGLVAEVQSG